MKNRFNNQMRLAVVLLGSVGILAGCAGSQFSKNIHKNRIAIEGEDYAEFVRDFNEFFVGKSEEHLLDTFWPNRNRGEDNQPIVENWENKLLGQKHIRYYWRPVRGFDTGVCNMYARVDDGVVTELGLRTQNGRYLNVGSCESALDRMTRYKTINNITPDYYYDKEK